MRRAQATIVAIISAQQSYHRRTLHIALAHLAFALTSAHITFVPITE